MQPLAVPLGKTTARLKRIDDHPIVIDTQAHPMHRLRKSPLGRLLGSKAPVKGPVLGRFGVQRFAACL